jgi:hypothetical protein
MPAAVIAAAARHRIPTIARPALRRQTLAAPGPATLQDGPARTRAHTRAEAVLALPATGVRLVGALHETRQPSELKARRVADRGARRQRHMHHATVCTDANRQAAVTGERAQCRDPRSGRQTTDVLTPTSRIAMGKSCLRLAAPQTYTRRCLDGPVQDAAVERRCPADAPTVTDRARDGLRQHRFPGTAGPGITGPCGSPARRTPVPQPVSHWRRCS